MIKVTDIIKAVNKKLNKEFNITVDSKDLKEVFERPSFRTDIEGFRSGRWMQTYRERKFTLQVYYFPKTIENNRVDILETQERLEKLLVGYIEIAPDFSIYISEVEFEVTDGVLIASMELETMEDIAVEADGENEHWMEELEIRRV